MRIFYSDEAPLDTLLQIASGPVWDGDLVSKPARDDFEKVGWVARCEGYNIITLLGRKAIQVLKLGRQAGELRQGIGETIGTSFASPNRIA